MERKVQKAEKPKQLIIIKPSKYESSAAIHRNKKYWKDVFNKLDGDGEKKVDKSEGNMLSSALPLDVCKKVCNILDIVVEAEKPSASIDTAMSLPSGPDLFFQIHASEYKPPLSPCLWPIAFERNLTDKKERRFTKEPMFSKRQILHFEREMDSDTDVEISSSEEDDEPNIHLEFLKKPIREQITWPTRYLEPERDDEKSLVKRADDLTDKIAQEFSDYIKQLGGDQQSQLFTPKAIKELFQIEFDTHVARSLQVLPKEMPTVDEKVAAATGIIEKSRVAALEQQITNDIQAEKRPDNLLAFQRRLPKQDQYRNPRNNTKNLWRSARHVPKDLVTLKAVWEGITNLRSVKEYCRWMIEHPEHRRAPYLNSLGMFDRAVLETRLTFETQKDLNPINVAESSNIPAPIEHIRKRLSELADGI